MKTCLTCKTEFIPRKDTQKWCSKKCTNKGVARSPEVRAKIGASHLGKKHTVEAKEKMSIAKIGKATWNLGRKHTDEAKLKNSLAHRGEKSAQWRGGVSSLIRLVRRGIRYRAWRTLVYERDSYTCVHCGEDKQYLNADHIIQFAILLRDNKIKTVEQAESCDALWDIKNGRTLCLPCHKKTDTYLNKGKEYLKQYVI